MVISTAHVVFRYWWAADRDHQRRRREEIHLEAEGLLRCCPATTTKTSSPLRPKGRGFVVLVEGGRGEGERRPRERGRQNSGTRAQIADSRHLRSEQSSRLLATVFVSVVVVVVVVGPLS